MRMSPTGGRGRSNALAASAALVMVGALLLVWALLNQQGSPPTPEPSGALSSPHNSAASEPTPAAETDSASQPASTDLRTGNTRQAAADVQVPALPRSQPVSVTIPAIGVTSDLHPLGLNGDGTLAVPSGALYDQAAWYEGSPTPGELGPAVIEGHVTSRGATPSVFFELGALAPGDTVDVARQDGTVATFEVYATDTFPKDDFPKVAVYGNTDSPELRLITCGGNYDRDARAHVDNIVVFAKMISHT